MKRIVAAVLGTVAGLVALLQFKTHTTPVAADNRLPSAGLPAASTDTATAAPPTPPTTTGPTTTTAPPTATAPPTRTGPTSTQAGRSSSAATRTVAGDPIDTPYGAVQVELTLTGSKITNVRFLRLEAFDRHSEQINSYAAPILLQETLQAQGANVDAVSGATYTSQGYMQSVQSALDKAGIR